MRAAEHDVTNFIRGNADCFSVAGEKQKQPCVYVMLAHINRPQMV